MGPRGGGIGVGPTVIDVAARGEGGGAAVDICPLAKGRKELAVIPVRTVCEVVVAKSRCRGRRRPLDNGRQRPLGGGGLLQRPLEGRDGALLGVGFQRPLGGLGGVAQRALDEGVGKRGGGGGGGGGG